ncbi:MAG TPA: OmpA family protein [Pseudomonadota bacterium]|mgnify:CR=1 FL=1|nr:OmpA family protein [Pseudomonadota bacterium]
MRVFGGIAIVKWVLWAWFILGSVQTAHAQNTRFDVQNFRPTPGPRDLIIIPQSQPLSHNSGAVGAYFSFSLDPLVLLNNDGQRVADVVKNRLELDIMAAYGLGNWLELGMVLPVILFQQSSNLESIGEEGQIQSTVVGDLAVLLKVPFVRRLSYAKGFGVSLQGRVNFPTGNQDAFASDGKVTFTPSFVADYRFGMGALLALQAGVHIRPVAEFMDVKLGPAFVGAAGAELPLIRKYGITTLGGVYFNVPLQVLPDSIRQIPAEAMLGLRWYASFGVTFTTGFNFGADCGFSIPTFRYFLAAVWVPGKTREYESIESFKKPPDDPDGDGLIAPIDHCPEEKGPAENNGCPERDADKDGIVDRLDDCPTLPGRKALHGCPRVYADDNKIKVLERIHFATDQDVILPESFSVLEEIADYIKSHPEWLEILIEGHCDIRADDAYNLNLSQRRANAVLKFLLLRGVEPNRLKAQGFGRSRPIATNDTEEGMALNRRVEFTILKVAPGYQLPRMERPDQLKIEPVLRSSP